MFRHYKNFWLKYFDFIGRTNVREFWSCALINFVIMSILAIIAFFVGFFGYVSGVFCLVIFVPSIAISLRRLRDAGRNLYNLLWILLPFVGWLLLIVYFCGPTIKIESTTNKQVMQEDKPENKV